MTTHVPIPLCSSLPVQIFGRPEVWSPAPSVLTVVAPAPTIGRYFLFCRWFDSKLDEEVAWNMYRMRISLSFMEGAAASYQKLAIVMFTCGPIYAGSLRQEDCLSSRI